ncbi:hypothetical protein PG996_008661 [Apiospora saccharicola]|uniref:Uncharacterized protein n=1 Tax=Apiospora saccharicola TaxID=335842 RepID=A0ABR1V1Q5_9PEZI
MDLPLQRMRNQLRTVMFGIFWDLLRGRTLLLKERAKLGPICVGIWANRAKLTMLDLLYCSIRLRPLVRSQLTRLVGCGDPDKASPPNG